MEFFGGTGVYYASVPETCGPTWLALPPARAIASKRIKLFTLLMGFVKT